MATNQTPGQSFTVRMDGEKYRIHFDETSHDSEFDGEVVLTRERDEQRWRFGVDRDGAVHVLDTNVRGGLAITPTFPKWVTFLLAGIGLGKRG